MTDDGMDELFEQHLPPVAPATAGRTAGEFAAGMVSLAVVVID